MLRMSRVLWLTLVWLIEAGQGQVRPINLDRAVCSLYIVRGFDKRLNAPDRAALERPNPDKQLRAFKNLFRAVAGRILDGSSDADPMNPASCGQDPGHSKRDWNPWADTCALIQCCHVCG